MKKRFNILILVVMLTSIILTGCGSNTTAGGEVADEDLPSLEIRVSACNSMEHPQTLGLDLFKDLVEADTDGKVTVKIYPNSQLGSERESVEQVKSGTLEMATASAGPLTTFDKGIMVMDIPFAFDNYEEAWATLDGEAGRDIFNSFENAGLKGLAWMENGFRHITTDTNPIVTPEDLKGLKIRTMEAPMHMENFTLLGANPTPVPWSDLYMSMSQGVVNGQENPIANIWEVNMAEVQDYVSLTGHIYDSMPLVANLDWFNKLPDQYKLIIEKAAIQGANYSRFINKLREDELVVLLEEKGMEVNALTADQKAVFRDASQQDVIDKIKEEVDPAFIDKYLENIEKTREDINKGM